MDAELRHYKANAHLQIKMRYENKGTVYFNNKIK